MYYWKDYVVIVPIASSFQFQNSLQFVYVDIRQILTFSIELNITWTISPLGKRLQANSIFLSDLPDDLSEVFSGCAGYINC